MIEINQQATASKNPTVLSEKLYKAKARALFFCPFLAFFIIALNLLPVLSEGLSVTEVGVFTGISAGAIYFLIADVYRLKRNIISD